MKKKKQIILDIQKTEQKTEHFFRQNDDWITSYSSDTYRERTNFLDFAILTPKLNQLSAKTHHVLY